jgi:hypothetical protein
MAPDKNIFPVASRHILRILHKIMVTPSLVAARYRFNGRRLRHLLTIQASDEPGVKVTTMARRLVIVDAESFTEDRQAMLMTLMPQDMYRLSNNWHSVQGYWQHGRYVEEVSHFGRHKTAVGDEVYIETETGKRVGKVRINQIAMANTAAFQDEDVRLLGYQSREEFRERVLGTRNQRAWLFFITPIKAWWEFWK